MIYFVQHRRGPIKIGVTSHDAVHRIKQFHPEIRRKVNLLAVTNGLYGAEKRLHRRFAKFSIGGEWFSPNPSLEHLINRLSESIDSRFEIKKFDQWKSLSHEKSRQSVSKTKLRNIFEKRILIRGGSPYRRCSVCGELWHTAPFHRLSESSSKKKSSRLFTGMTIQNFIKEEGISTHALATRAGIIPSRLYRFLMPGKRAMQLRMSALDKIVRASHGKISHVAAMLDYQLRRYS